MLLAVLAVGAAVVLAAAGFLAVQLLRDDTANVTVAPGPTVGTVATTPEPATLEATREVRVHGKTVQVRQTIHLVQGDPVKVGPVTSTPAIGLVPLGVTVVAEDGTHPAFNKPMTVSSGRSIAVEGRYRLDDCPDLLPTQWPSPSAVVSRGDWTMNFTRIDEPQRTARALCASSKSKAKPLSGLKGAVVNHESRVVQLRWTGGQPATLKTIGSVSGVAATSAGNQCAGECVVRLRPHSATRIRLHLLEACPIGGKSNLMTVQVLLRHAKPHTVAVPIKALAPHVCR
ncbi:MAG TPA: hypothetical protein VMT27_00025 [Actinomycetes bacterium]|nr:hypothetical protein [Actinomycetes bacterium]